MQIDINKIISVNELTTDRIKSKLIDLGELYVFEDNKLQFVIVHPSIYESLIGNSEMGTKSTYEKSDIIEEQKIENLLSSIGKKIFVDFYDIFKEDINVEDKLPTNLSLSSRRSRASASRKLFRENLNLNALESIANSKKLDEETINKARRLLLNECNADELGKTNLHQIEKQWKTIDKRYSMKIGSLVRKMMQVLFKNESISDDEIQLMLTSSYSKEVFNLNFPVLKEVPETCNDIGEIKKDANGYNRYYDFTLTIYGKKYILCSQWTEQLHREYFEKWLDKIQNELEEE